MAPSYLTVSPLLRMVLEEPERLAVVLQSLQSALDGSLRLVERSTDGFGHGRSPVGGSDGLATFDAHRCLSIAPMLAVREGELAPSRYSVHGTRETDKSSAAPLVSVGAL